MDVEDLAGLGFDPFTIDVGYILLEQRWIVQLAGQISKCRQALRVVPKIERTGGMLWFGAMAYVLVMILGKEED